MKDQQSENRGPIAIVIIAAVVLLLAGLAYMGKHATETQVAETIYGMILTSPPARPEIYPTEEARLDRCEKILESWRSLDRPTIDLEAVGADLPLPLRLTRTTRIANPEDFRKRAGPIFARDLAALSGRQVPSATPAAWASEIAAWRATIGH